MNRSFRMTRCIAGAVVALAFLGAFQTLHAQSPRKGLKLKNDSTFAVEYAITSDPNKLPLTTIVIRPGAMRQLFVLPNQEHLWWRYEGIAGWACRTPIPDGQDPVYRWKFVAAGAAPNLVGAPEIPMFPFPGLGAGGAGPKGPGPIGNPINPGLAAKPNLAVTITWNTTSDVDLVVTEPGAVCSYQNRQTANGGVLHEDNQTGFGPEHYTIARAPKGQYVISVNHYRAAGPTTVQVEVIRFAGTANQTSQRFTVNLRGSGDRVEVCKIQY